VTTDTLTIISCGKAKRELAPGETCRAVDLYTGSLYRARLAYARALGHPIAIVSAKYGLLTPEERVETYEEDLRKVDPEARAAWAQRVAAQIARHVAKGLPASSASLDLRAYVRRIVALCSGPYLGWRGPLRETMPRVDVRVPVEGPIGQQIRTLRAQASSIPLFGLAYCGADMPAGPRHELSVEDELAWWARQPALDDEDVCEVSGAALRQLLAAHQRDLDAARAVEGVRFSN